MTGFKTARQSSSAEGLFSTQEIQQLMRVEFDRAQRYGFPIVCMKIGVDRFAALQDLYGLESKHEILRTVIALLKSVTRDSDFLAYLVVDRLLAVFPHTPSESAALVAQRLLAGARGMTFDSGGRSLRITLSIGVAHNQHPGSLSFETLVDVADEGLAVADAAGGDRFVETELYQLFEQKRSRAKASPAADLLRRPTRLMAVPAEDQAPPSASDRVVREFVPMQAAPVPTPVPAPAPPPADPGARSLSEKLYALIASQGEDEGGLTDDEKFLIVSALSSMAPQREGVSDSEYKRQVEVLERRLAKLTSQLGMTEEELKRIAKMKNIDLGLHSIYRTIQGIADDDGQAELKREMMSAIFEANVKLKKRIASEAS
jgi:diguanylate cyclase (GGDEF)-like protein